MFSLQKQEYWKEKITKMNIIDVTSRFIMFYEYCVESKIVRSTAEFAKITGMTRGGLAEIIKGKNNVGLRTVMNTLQSFEVLNRYWLLFGEQEMLNNESVHDKSIQEKSIINNSVIVEILTSEIERLRKELNDKGESGKKSG